MKTLAISILFASGLMAQSTAASKPEAPAATKPAVTALTVEEKLAIRDLQLAITQMKHQQDVEIPKAISEAQDKINKLVADLVTKHNATGSTLKYDLTWDTPPAAPEPKK